MIDMNFIAVSDVQLDDDFLRSVARAQVAASELVGTTSPALLTDADVDAARALLYEYFTRPALDSNDEMLERGAI